MDIQERVDSKHHFPKKSQSFNEAIAKFNPYHDMKGRFSRAHQAAFFTIQTKDPTKQHWADRGIAREKIRTAAMAGPVGQKASVHEIENKIRNQNYESLAVVDKNNNVLVFKNGQTNEVAYTIGEQRMMRGNVVTHNHPSGSTFSGADVRSFVDSKCSEIRATTASGKTYSLRRNANYDYSDNSYATRHKEYQFALEFDKADRKATAKAQRTLDNKKYYEKIARGEVSQKQANNEMMEIITAEMNKFFTNTAPNYGFEYSIETQ